MKASKNVDFDVPRDLGNGLILRRATEADMDALSAFNAQIHSEEGPDKPDERISAWTRDLIKKPHPTFNVGDFTIVEDIGIGEIVSSLNIISQTWVYEGIPFGVGRPELVGTHPEYRNRGLVRAQFEVIHQWSLERGEKLQAITGIPYYYRQFGYEMCISLGGGRYGYNSHLPKLGDDEGESYRVRPAGVDDLGFIDQLYRQSNEQRYLLYCQRDNVLWHHELNGKSANNINRSELRAIVVNDGECVGYLTHNPYIWGTHMVATAYEIKPGISWAAVTPSVIRYLSKTGENYANKGTVGVECSGFGFRMGIEHPVYEVLQDTLPRVRKPYAWFVRLPDIADFIQHITTALEKRLESSPYTGHTGELRLTFYRSGLKISFEGGQLTAAEPWQPTPFGHSGDAAFPELSFLQLLFGYRSLDELDYAFADCWTDNEQTAGILNVLFPKKVSNIWPIS